MRRRDVRLVWMMLATGLLASSRASGQAVLLNPPAAPVAPGATAEVVVYFLNDGAAPLRVTPQEQLTTQARWDGGASPLTLTRVSGAGGAGVDVAPGAFARGSYRFEVPSSARGQMTLTLPGSPPVVLAVGAPGTVGPDKAGTPAGAVRGETAAPPAPIVTSDNGASPPGGPPAATVVVPERIATSVEVVEYFRRHFSAYEPMYFLVGPDEPNAKFQISFKYQIFNDEAPVVDALPPLGGLHFAYSQTSFWDLESASSPFFDNSYRPQLMLSYDDLLDDRRAGPLRQLGLQAGLQHESNGQDGDDSRSTNYLYVRPTFTFGAAPADDPRAGRFFVSVSPRLHAYLGDDEDNPEIEEFRGYGDLHVVLGHRAGLQFAATGRLGKDLDKGSLQLDVSHPLRPLLRNNLDLFLHGQFFTGYGESLLLYDESDTTFRVGVSLTR